MNKTGEFIESPAQLQYPTWTASSGSSFHFGGFVGPSTFLRRCCGAAEIWSVRSNIGQGDPLQRGRPVDGRPPGPGQPALAALRRDTVAAPKLSREDQGQPSCEGL